jgi:hypothetical protein
VGVLQEDRPVPEREPLPQPPVEDSLGELRDPEVRVVLEFHFLDEMDMMAGIAQLDWFRFHEPLWKESPWVVTILM